MRTARYFHRKIDHVEPNDEVTNFYHRLKNLLSSKGRIYTQGEILVLTGIISPKEFVSSQQEQEGKNFSSTFTHTNQGIDSNSIGQNVQNDLQINLALKPHPAEESQKQIPQTVLPHTASQDVNVNSIPNTEIRSLVAQSVHNDHNIPIGNPVTNTRKRTKAGPQSVKLKRQRMEEEREQQRLCVTQSLDKCGADKFAKANHVPIEILEVKSLHVTVTGQSKILNQALSPILLPTNQIQDSPAPVQVDAVNHPTSEPSINSSAFPEQESDSLQNDNNGILIEFPDVNNTTQAQGIIDQNIDGRNNCTNRVLIDLSPNHLTPSPSPETQVNANNDENCGISPRPNRAGRQVTFSNEKDSVYYYEPETYHNNNPETYTPMRSVHFEVERNWKRGPQSKSSEDIFIKFNNISYGAQAPQPRIAMAFSRKTTSTNSTQNQAKVSLANLPILPDIEFEYV